MTTFQILTLIISGLFLLSGIITVYMTLRIQMAEIKLQIKHIEKDLVQKEVAVLLNEKNNREDHFRILDKLDKLLKNNLDLNR